MSLSIPAGSSLPSPVKKYIEFSGKTGEFTYYDKEKEEKVVVPMPITFTVLDQLSTMTGFHEATSSGIYANEVHKTSEEPLTVRAFKGGEIAMGIYADIKDKVKAVGGKYAKSVYAYMNGEVVKFTFCGASLSPWIDSDIDFHNQSVLVDGTVTGKKGSNEYKMPVFKATEMQDKETAIEADKQVQEYLSSRTAPKDEALQHKELVSGLEAEEIKIDDLPF